jgi:hypothetical protein
MSHWQLRFAQTFPSVPERTWINSGVETSCAAKIKTPPE